MSTAMRYPPDFGYAGMTMTAGEYLALGETPERYELVHGVILMSPSPLAGHNEILAELVYQLKVFAARESAVRVFPDTDVRFADESVYRPDVSVYRRERFAGKIQRLEEAPDLVIEVLSPGNRGLDLVTKKRDYERFGVGEYWVIDPTNGDVRVWRRKGSGFEEAAVRGESVESSALPGFVLDLRPIRKIVKT